ncbi:MAG: hypothetical protein K2X82_28700 [Gemmataceae bacterium]|nr:hypothetical protein [Gemmataceae bacterium]
MAFGNYTSTDDVIARHKVRCLLGRAVAPAADAPPFGEYFRAELEFNLREFAPGRSEIGAGELVLFPLLREVWKSYRPELLLFTHEPLEYDADLCGTPDYFVCKRSEFGPTYPTTPYLLVVEAKLDDFTRAWGQCLAAMLAAQKLNGLPEQPVYGITTNGNAWQFGVLRGNEFTLDPQAVGLHNLDTVGQMLHAAFRACRDLALAPPAPAAP